MTERSEHATLDMTAHEVMQLASIHPIALQRKEIVGRGKQDKISRDVSSTLPQGITWICRASAKTGPSGANATLHSARLSEIDFIMIPNIQEQETTWRFITTPFCSRSIHVPVATF